MSGREGRRVYAYRSEVLDERRRRVEQPVWICGEGETHILMNDDTPRYTPTEILGERGLARACCAAASAIAVRPKVKVRRESQEAV